MIFPIRCFTCGKLLADKWLPYSEGLQQAYDKAANLPKKVSLTSEESESHKLFVKFNISRPCCRRMFLGHVDMFEML